VYVGPVAGECDGALLAGLRGRFVGAGLQGWLRRTEAGDGRVVPALLPEALEPPPLGVAVVSELDHPEVELVAGRFAAAGATVAITRGARGATILSRAGRLQVPAAQAVQVDPTGAGDVFGVMLTLHLGPAWYGYGFAVSLLVVVALALYLLDRKLDRLEYETYMLQ